MYTLNTIEKMMFQGVYIMAIYTTIIVRFFPTYTNAETGEPVFRVSRNLIVNTTDDSILSTPIARFQIYCVWYCMRNVDCFAVNSIPREGSYTCELLPVVVETYDIITSIGASYYRKPCLFEANAFNEMIKDPYTVGVQYVLFRESVTIEAAIQSCKTYNMKLLALETQAEFNLISSTFTDFTDLWVAAYEIGTTDVFKWINHSFPIDYYYNAWGVGEPDSRYGGEHCVVYHHPIQAYADVECESIRNYVCECPYLID